MACAGRLVGILLYDSLGRFDLGPLAMNGSAPTEDPLAVLHRMALEETGPVTTLDAALALVGRGGLGSFLGALSAGVPVAFFAVALHYLERVEGVSSLRPLFAALLVAGWMFRGVRLAHVARGYVHLGWPGFTVPEGAGAPLSIARSLCWASLGLPLWLVIFALASWFHEVLVLCLLPLLSLRAFWTPSALASFACGERAGFLGMWTAFRDGEDRRGTAVLVDAMMWVAALLVAVNLHALLGLLVLFTRSLLGFDAAFVEGFTSFENDFFLVLVGVFAVLLLEPVRAAVSAVHLLDVRVRRQGLDLEQAVDWVTSRMTPAGLRKDDALSRQPADSRALKSTESKHAAVTRSSILGGTSALLCSALVFLSPPALAQPPGEAGWTPEDARVQAHAEEILSRDLFREIETGEGVDLSRWLADLLHDLLDGLVLPEFSFKTPTPLPLPAPPPALFLAVAAAVLVVVFWIAWRLWRAPAPTLPTTDPLEPTNGEDPTAKAPEAHLDAAAALAAQGRFRDALRALYLATLVSLDHSGTVAFDPSRTNGQILRFLSPGPVRHAFRTFTELFEVKWYGDETTTGQDIAEARKLAEEITGLLAKRGQ